MTEEQVLGQCRPHCVTAQCSADLDDWEKMLKKLNPLWCPPARGSDEGVMTEVFWRYCFSSGVDGMETILQSIDEIQEAQRNSDQKLKVRLNKQWRVFNDKCDRSKSIKYTIN